MIASKLEGEPTFQALNPKSDNEVPDATAVDGENNVEGITDRNIFDSKATKEGPVIQDPIENPTEEVVPNGKAVLTSLKIKLLSTFQVGDGTTPESSAIIVGDGSRSTPALYSVGDENGFAPDTKITKIVANRVEFINKGKNEYVMLEDWAKVSSKPTGKTDGKKTEDKESKKPSDIKVEQAADGTILVDRAEIQYVKDNISQFANDARFDSNKDKDGAERGMKITSLQPKSILKKLALKRGDVLLKFNGQDITLVYLATKGEELFAQMLADGKASIVIERGGKEQTLNYLIQ